MPRNPRSHHRGSESSPPEPIVIVHGWSDRASSFKDLGEFLRAQLGTTVSTIDLADWLSLNDEITYQDLVTALDMA